MKHELVNLLARSMYEYSTERSYDVLSAKKRREYEKVVGIAVDRLLQKYKIQALQDIT